MKLSFWVNLLAIKQLLREKNPLRLFYKHWKERLMAMLHIRGNLTLTQQHLSKQRLALQHFEVAHNFVAFENPSQSIQGNVFNQQR